ncbi:MAG: hypothetical protein NT069_20680, partial [Planctomycetota bacterium]|nr:hypothetical protein [Planctomycetota bacterium]
MPTIFLSPKRLCFCLTLLGGWAIASPLCTADDASSAPTGIAKRIPWTTSRVVGRPDPPLPFQAVRAFPNLPLEFPLHIIAEPMGAVGSPEGRPERIFIVEQKGRIIVFPND